MMANKNFSLYGAFHLKKLGYELREDSNDYVIDKARIFTVHFRVQYSLTLRAYVFKVFQAKFTYCKVHPS